MSDNTFFSHLAHEVGDDPVEAGALETESFLTSAQSTEVLAGLWNHVRSELQDKNYVSLQNLKTST